MATTKKVITQPLNPRQQRFIDEYLVDLNGTQAVLRSGYGAKNAKSAGVIANRLLADARVAAEIQKRLAGIKEELKLTRERVINELATIAFARATDFATIESGIVKAKDTALIQRDKLPAIAEIKETMYGVSVKLHDKVRALELLGKYMSIFDGNAAGNDVEDLEPLADMLMEKEPEPGAESAQELANE